MKVLLVIIVQLFMLKAFGQVRHIVFDLEGTVVVKVPNRIKEASSDKNQYINVDNETLRIYPHASATLESLMSDKQNIVHIISNKRIDYIRNVLEAVPGLMNKESNLYELFAEQGPGKIWDEDAFEGGKFDLRKVTSDFKNILYVCTRSSALLPSQNSLIYLLSEHYFYESVEHFNKEKKYLQSRSDWATKHEAFVPKDDYDWQKSFHRMAILHEKILALKKMVSNDLVENLKEIKDENPFLKSGIDWAKNSYRSKKLSWIIQDNKVVGCQGIDIRSQLKTPSQSVDDCSNVLPKFKYSLDEKECFEFTANLDLIGKSEACDSNIDKYITYNKVTKKYELKFIDNSKFLNHRLMNRNGSFRRTILSNKGYSVMAELSEDRPGCGEEVRRIYKNGGNLYSRILEKAVRPIKSIRFGSGVQDNFFFHLTGSKEFADTFNVTNEELQKLNGPVEDVFVYFRTKEPQFFIGPSHYHSNWGKVFYLTEHTDSLMKWYSGTQGIKFEINPEAKLVTLDRVLFEKALDEVAERHPGIKVFCGTRFDTSLLDTHARVEYHGLVFLLAEDSGIDVLDYYQANLWFQFISPDSFIGAKTIGKVGNGVPINGNKFYSPPDKSYLVTPVLSVVSATYGDKDATSEVSRIIDGKINFKYQAELSGFHGDLKLIVECLPGGVPRAESLDRQTYTVSKNDLKSNVLKLNCN